MKKLSLILLSVILFVACQEEESKPEIMTFEPSTGNIGDRVTITGSNFGAGINENWVQFGDEMAEVESATPTQLVVIVPPNTKSGSTISVVVAGEKRTESTATFTVKTGSWKKIADAPFIGESATVATFTIGQSAYFAYGQSTPYGGVTVDAGLWQYNQTSGLWTKKTPIAADFEQDGSSAWGGSNGKGYLLGSSGDLYEYNPESDSWLKKAAMPDLWPNYVVTAFTIGENGYAFLNNRALYKYSTASNTWSNVPVTMPDLIAWVFAVGDKAYFSVHSGTMYEWSPNTPTTVTNMEITTPVPVIVDPTIRGGGSQFGYAGETYNPEREFYQFNTSEKRWIQKAAYMGDQRYSPVSFSIGGKFYSGLGAKTTNDSFVRDIYEYTPE